MFVEAPISSMLCSQESRDFSHERFKGMLVDNTNSKYGKFIPWLVVGTLVNAVIFVILFGS